MNLINTIVIDDESLNRDLVSELICRIDPNFKIEAMADNIDTAYTLINDIKPDVIFLDIKMPNGSGFDLLKRFETINFEVVFVTGFDEYAILAFDFNALDYVLKPIDYDKLTQTLNKVVNRIQEKRVINHRMIEVLNTYNLETNKIYKISVHYNDQVYLLDVQKIASVISNAGCTIFKTMEGKEYSSAKQFSAFEFILNQYKNFCKINKGTYINLSYLKSYSKGSVCEITLTNESVFEVSRRKKTEILSIIDEGNL